MSIITQVLGECQAYGGIHVSEAPPKAMENFRSIIHPVQTIIFLKKGNLLHTDRHFKG